MSEDVFSSVNPYTLKTIAHHQPMQKVEAMSRLLRAQAAFQEWCTTPIAHRSQLMHNLASILQERITELAQMATLEMGKPVEEARAEIIKCIGACVYYADNAASFLAIEEIQTEYSYSAVRSDPLGVILAIMPWNYPYWQVIRCAIPALCAGNVVLLKHAPNVLGCANLIVQAMYDAQIPSNVVQTFDVPVTLIPDVIAHEAIAAISLTGSERAGRSVASVAGTHLKKCVLELGGSNAFVVCDDADIQKAIDVAVAARMGNAGQSCLAAKRFIVHESIIQQFIDGFISKVKQLVVGDPLQKETQIGPLARVDLAENLERQMLQSMAAGAVLLYGGKREGALFHPTVLSNVLPGMPAFDEETFGPLACFTTARSNEHAMTLASQSKYGLGLSVFTSNVKRVQEYIPSIADGTVAINAMVKSDARLPFGGTRCSGYGRELSRDGIMEFVNRKTVVIQEPSGVTS